MAQESRKSELINELALSRETIATSFHGLRRDLNVKRRMERSISQNKLAWAGGASAVGFALAKLTGRRKAPSGKGTVRRAKDSDKKVVEAGLLITALKIAFDLLRPALTKWLTRWVTEYAAQRFASKSR